MLEGAKQSLCVPIKRTGVLLVLLEELVDLLSDLSVRDLDVVLGGTVLRHEGKESIIGNVELEFAG